METLLGVVIIETIIVSYLMYFLYINGNKFMKIIDKKSIMYNIYTLCGFNAMKSNDMNDLEYDIPNQYKTFIPQTSKRYF